MSNSRSLERGAPEEEAGGRFLFATTHWSVVLTAGSGDAADVGDALEKLCRTYWPPLYAYVRRRGYSPADAEDLTQAFFAWLLERNWLGRANRERGRFRSFLLTSIGNFLANEWDKGQTWKRGRGRVVSLQRDDVDTRELVDHLTPEQDFEWRWALTVLDQVMSRLGAEFKKEGKAELFDTLKPCLLGERAVQPYAALAARLGMTDGAVKVAVHRLRQRYRQLLREEIAGTVEKREEVDEEMRYLFAVLAGGGRQFASSRPANA